MAKGKTSIFDKFAHRRALARWTSAAQTADKAPLSDLKKQRDAAKVLRGRLNDLLDVADGRLALPKIGSMSFPRPSGTLWAWRPQVWRAPLNPKGVASVPSKTKLGRDFEVFHDCPLSQITMRQLRNTSDTDLAPFGLCIEVFDFRGSFMSLVLNFPETALDGLKKTHILRICPFVEIERHTEVFLRLNIKNGPNTEQLVQEVAVNSADAVVEFDLAYTDLNEKRLGSMWLDMIFENPKMNKITLRDMTLCRYPRAEL